MAQVVLPADAVYHVSGRKDTRSALKKLIDRTEIVDMQSVVACPYGCLAADQDRLGYCKHLIGFVDDHKLPEGEVKKLPPEGVEIELVSSEHDEHGRRVYSGKGKLKKGDYLLRITTTCRVYRAEPESEPTPANPTA